MDDTQCIICGSRHRLLSHQRRELIELWIVRICAVLLVGLGAYTCDFLVSLLKSKGVSLF
jgi:hypothetical protein